MTDEELVFELQQEILDENPGLSSDAARRLAVGRLGVNV